MGFISKVVELTWISINHRTSVRERMSKRILLAFFLVIITRVLFISGANMSYIKPYNFITSYLLHNPYTWIKNYRGRFHNKRAFGCVLDPSSKTLNLELLKTISSFKNCGDKSHLLWYLSHRACSTLLPFVTQVESIKYIKPQTRGNS